MGKQNPNLPILQLRAYKNGEVTDIYEGAWGHNALFKRQNQMFNDGAEKVEIYRMDGEWNKK